MATKVILIRPGESAWHAQGRFQGQADVPLSARGKQQIQVLGQRLQSWGIDAVYASPLLRSQETAAAIARIHALPVNIEKDLIEIDQGLWQGLTLAEVRGRFGHQLIRWHRHPSTVSLPEGESFDEFRERSLEALARIVTRHPQQAVAVITHDGVIKLALVAALGMDFDNLDRFVVEPAGITMLEFSDDAPPRLLCFNDTCHLQAPSGQPDVQNTG